MKQSKFDLINQIIKVVEILTALISVLDIFVLCVLKETISYEYSDIFNSTPKSSVFTIMEHIPITGYVFFVCLITMVTCTFVRVFINQALGLKRLRNNYNTVLKLNDKKSIERFLSKLSEREEHELFSYTYKYVIQDRKRKGYPISEYFLLHYDDFIPSITIQKLEKADRCINFIYLFVMLLIAIILVFK